MPQPFQPFTTNTIFYGTHPNLGSKLLHIHPILPSEPTNPPQKIILDCFQSCHFTLVCPPHFTPKHQPGLQHSFEYYLRNRCANVFIPYHLLTHSTESCSTCLHSSLHLQLP